MPGALDALVGTLPIILVSGLAMNMTERIISSTNRYRRAPRRSTRRRRARTRSGSYSGMSFGNFSNIGY